MHLRLYSCTDTTSVTHRGLGGSRLNGGDSVANTVSRDLLIGEF
jgi:hypothetical protein